MKIQGPNRANINAYQNQLHKPTEHKVDKNRKDNLEISKEAKQLLEKQKPNEARKAYVQEIKQAISSGAYKVDHEKTAQKMIDFWSKHK